MSRDPWDKRRIERADALWQLYHENSKGSRFDRQLPPESALAWQQSLLPSISYDGHPALALPPPHATFAKSLERTLLDRATASGLTRRQLPLDVLSTLLHYGYGVTRQNDPAVYPSPFRAVPSGGALYPLELYVHAAAIDGMEPGLYHYEPANHLVRRFGDGDRTEELAARVAQPAVVHESSSTIFITALFERSTTKYGDRGYRFVLLEAGHVAQNLALIASALDLPAMNIGGFFDRPIDELLGLDGVQHSTLYLFALGGAV